MRRLRVTGAMKKQLADLHDTKGNARRGGVMVVPRMLAAEEWEKVAVPAQQALLTAARDEMHGVANARTDPADVIYHHLPVSPHPETSQAEHERQYQLHRRHTIESARGYLAHQERQVTVRTAK